MTESEIRDKNSEEAPAPPVDLGKYIYMFSLMTGMQTKIKSKL